MAAFCDWFSIYILLNANYFSSVNKYTELSIYLNLDNFI